MNDKENDMNPKLEDIPILKEFEYIFSGRSPCTSSKKGYRLDNRSDT